MATAAAPEGRRRGRREGSAEVVARESAGPVVEPMAGTMVAMTEAARTAALAVSAES